MTERDPHIVGYCKECKHPNGYHTEDRGCTMPLGPTGLPLGRNEIQVSTCRCGAPETGRKDVDVFIENIASGTCDPYLEAILAAAHGRKRALRNVTRPYGRRLNDD